MADVLMPKLSDTMEEGTVLRWLKRPGERVELGDLLVEVETDKADMEVEATVAGVLREVRLDAGESGRVGAVIAVIEDGDGEATGDEAESAPAKKERSSGEDGVARAEAKPRRSDRSARSGSSADEKSAREPKAEKKARDGESEEGADGREEETPRAEASGRADETEDGEGAADPGRAKAAAPRAAVEKDGERPDDARPSPSSAKGKVRVSPLARSLAAELGVDPESVPGTGPGGRVVRRDIEAAARVGGNGAKQAPAAAAKESRTDAPRAVASAPARGASDDAEKRTPEATSEGERDEAPPAPPVRGEKPSPGGTPVARPTARGTASPRPPAPEGTRKVPLTPMRASIARRMTESKREAPHFYLTTITDMDAAAALRESLRTSGTVAAGVTYNHMIVKAAADALRVFPELNSRFAGDAVELLAGIHVGVATAVPEGLIVPVIHDADRLSLVEIAATARALGEKAKGRSFSGDDLSGGTFTVSNLGMYEIESFAAVINPPQAAILAVGSVRQRPHVRDGALGAAYTVALTLSCDHRAVDGARGAEFLRDVKGRLENPTRLLFPAADS